MPPTLLYHYTGQNALLSILEKGVMRATHSKFMNDRAEITKGLQSYRNAIRDSNSPSASGAPRTLENTSDYFISCFSSEGNQIAMWSQYGAGGGYAIGFKSQHLQDISNSPTVGSGQLRQVHYDVASYEEAVEADLSESTSGVDAKFFSMAAALKDSSWEHEREWRFVLAHVEDQRHAVFFEGCGGFPRPYVEWHLPKPSKRPPDDLWIARTRCTWWEHTGARNECPIDQIMIGPSRYQTERYDALQYLVGDYRLPVDVHRSKLELRDL